MSWVKRIIKKFQTGSPSEWPYYDSDYYKYSISKPNNSVGWSRSQSSLITEPEPEPLSLPEDSEADFEEQLDRIVLENQDSDDEFNAALDELIDRMHNLGY